MLTANVVQPATWGKTMQPNNINRGAVADSDILRSFKLLKQRAPHFVRRPLFSVKYLICWVCNRSTVVGL